MANQRSKKRNTQIGFYVEPDVKAYVGRAAKLKNMTVADYIRNLLRAERKKKEGVQNGNH